MASVNLALVLSVTSLLLLLLLSDAASLPSTADESTAAAFALDAPGDVNPTQVLDPRLENTVTVTSTEANLPVLVDGFDRVGLSLRRPFHRRRSHCHHGHRLRSREVVPYEEWSSASRLSTSIAAEEAMNWGTVTKRNKEHKKKKRAEEEGSDSDSDDEGMDLGKKELRKKKNKRGKKERGGWMKWFWALWD